MIHPNSTRALVQVTRSTKSVPEECKTFGRKCTQVQALKYDMQWPPSDVIRTSSQHYSLSLIDDNRVLQEITHVDSFTTSQYLRMFLTKQPAHVSKKESATSVMRISVSFTELVMYTVISAPFINVILFVQK